MEDIKILESKDGDSIRIYTPFNPDFVEKIKKMGGKWNPSCSAWECKTNRISIVRDMLLEIYGYNDIVVPENVDIEIYFPEEVDSYRSGIYMFGKEICSAFGRDSGAKIGADAALISGEINSGGSCKNWRTKIYSDSVIRLFNVPKEKFLEEKEDEEDFWKCQIKLLEKDTDSVSLEKLIEEKTELEKRLALINAQIEDIEKKEK